MALFERLASGYYDNNDYPKIPKKPFALLKTAGALTVDELKNISIIKCDYDALMRQYHDDVRNFNNRKNELRNDFEHDLAEEYGLLDHPKLNLIFAKAWDRNHSEGFSSVANEYANLVELVL